MNSFSFVLQLFSELWKRGRRRSERRWITWVGLGAAVFVLIARMGLAYRNTAVEPKSAHAAKPSQSDPAVYHHSSGDSSPNLQNVRGDIHFTYEGRRPAGHE